MGGTIIKSEKFPLTLRKWGQGVKLYGDEGN